MTDHTPLTDQQLDDIEARTNARRAALSGWINCYSPLDEQEALENAEAVLVDDVPALVAEVRRLRRQRAFLLDQIAKKDARSGEGDRALREFLGGEEQPDEVAASLRRDGFGVDEIADMLGPGVTDGEAPEPTLLRWGLDDVMYGDGDSTIVMLSGPEGEPYWLELEPERAAALRESLAGPEGADEEPETGTRQCGHDDYHDPHEWADRPGIWCPGHSVTDTEDAANQPAAVPAAVEGAER